MRASSPKYFLDMVVFVNGQGASVRKRTIGNQSGWPRSSHFWQEKVNLLFLPIKKHVLWNNGHCVMFPVLPSSKWVCIVFIVVILSLPTILYWNIGGDQTSFSRNSSNYVELYPNLAERTEYHSGVSMSHLDQVIW